ncbi:sensor histidine kinase [Paludisphaera mucosa]|uniref:histidine kinase n=1 Tax=Paludisphaera mucosa TaxID=3030827 RepID=A0ABT6F701_9BACT|nr:ATP-binding protein [Paludisphaera mucosa]MDG3003350.1 ATP-binding protein [Paludisphaera mucosa]
MPRKTKNPSETGVETATPEADAPISTLDQIEALRRQVTALQRISSLGILAGGVFHELNNALTPILNYAKLGLRNPDPEYRERALKRILEAAQRATTITGSMLGLSRPGRDPNHREPVDLGRLLDDVVMLIGKDLNRHNVRLDLRAADRPFAKVNATQIQQVLINLLINARQAMPDGGVVRLKLELDPSGRMAELSVTDQGVGIAPEHLRRIFEPFFSTKSGPDAAGLGGTGLGLSVCRDIVEAHHGRIRAESRQGRGSTFTLLLPACAPGAEAATHVGAA